MKYRETVLQTDAHDITDLLLSWRRGNPSALTELMPLVYRHLLEIAGYLLRRESRDPDLEPTSLVHEAYLRLVEIERISWKDRTHFFAMCSRIMRRLLIDQARAQCREKRGGGAKQTGSTKLWDMTKERAPGLVALDEALDELADHDSQKAKIVELRFFGGLDREEIAQVLGISSATVTRRWRCARAWLIRYLTTEAS